MTRNELCSRAYAPYSGEPRCAVVESERGTRFAGVRVENLSFPLTIGAARSALFACLSEGHRPRRLYADADEGEARWLSESWELDLHPLEKAFPEEGISPPPAFFNPLRADPGPAFPLLRDLLEKAHVPHSDFPVAAVLNTDRGRVTGVNIEFDEWSMGLCAERVAIAKALAAGAGKYDVLHIHSRDGEFSSPCGACRQVLAEHMPGGRVCLHHGDGTRSDFFIRDLLPYGFHTPSLIRKHR